jgi:uncharacterized protein YbjT (DUF2867 family)
MNILIFGATGMIGQATLREALLHPSVQRVVTVGRRATGQVHPKLREIVLPDVSQLVSVENELVGFDGCLFCLGVSSAGMSEERYTMLTFDLTVGIAQVLARLNPQMTFVYVSGVGADSSERGRVMWARVRGRTENTLIGLPFKAVYIVRPGVIVPLHGITSRTRWTRAAYLVTKPILPLMRRLFPNHVLTTEQLGRAMLLLVRDGFDEPVLEPPEINRLIPSNRARLT